MAIIDLQKRITEGETKLKQQQNLYEAVRADRNLYRCAAWRRVRCRAGGSVHTRCMAMCGAVCVAVLCCAVLCWQIVHAMGLCHW